MADRTMEDLLQSYYETLETKGQWADLLADDFLLTGTVVKETKGRDQYAENSFFKLVRSYRVKEMVIGGDSAFALVAYDLSSPTGKAWSCDVAEFWRAGDGRLTSVAIYFDTAAFAKFMAP